MIQRAISARRAVVVVPMLASLVLSPLIVPGIAHAEDTSEAAKTEARNHYDRGIQLYKEGAYEAAFVEFERAYKLYPSFRILYNMGQVRYELNDFAGALTIFRQYLKDGGADVPADKKADVTKLVGQLEVRVASITIVVDAPGAIITIDDLPVGKSPLTAPILVNIGYRKISASKDGKTDLKLVTVAGGDKVDVSLSVGQSAAVVVDDKPKTTNAPVPWVPWAITGVLAVSAVTMGLLTAKKGSDLSAERDDPSATRESLDSKLSEKKTFAITTDILAAGAVIAGGISLYLTLTRNSSSSSTTTNTGATSIDVGVGPGSVAVFGAF
jgi:hypothetical protein